MLLLFDNHLLTFIDVDALGCRLVVQSAAIKGEPPVGSVLLEEI